MPKAARGDSASPAPVVTGTALPDHSATLAQLRAIVARSGDAALFGDGEVSPDQKLLELCAECLEYTLASNRCLSAAQAALRASVAERRPYCDDGLAEESQRWHRRSVPLMRAIGKIPASTPAGVYAKAAVVRVSRTGCTGLAQSMANDLLGNPVLRAALWPAQVAA